MSVSMKFSEYIFTRMGPMEENAVGQAASRKGCKGWILDNAFLLATLSGVTLGTLLGFLLRPMELSADVILVISYPGELFMRVLKLMILPFVMSCLIVGTATLNIKKNGKIAIRTITYFLLTSLFNVLLGLALVLTIHPGNSMVKDAAVINAQEIRKTNLLDGFLDMGRNLVPDNLFQAAFEQTFTEYVPVPNKDNESTSENSSDISAIKQTPMKRQLQYREGTNTLGIIFFCLIFGSVLGTLGPHKQVVINFFNVIYEVLLKVLMGAIWFTPLGVGSVICGKIISIGQLSQTLTQLSWFIATMAGGVLLYQLVFLQLIYFVFVRKNPFKYYVTFGPSIITAFATASKSASMPITFQIMDEKAKVDRRITRFILPIGTINMDGTALFITVSLVFIAQMNNMVLGVGELITIVLSCTVASMSSATVPSAALVLVLMLCSTISAPTDDVALLYAVDWFVDRLRTTNNLLGDCYACAVIESLSKKELRKIIVDEERPEQNGAVANNHNSSLIEVVRNGHATIK